MIARPITGKRGLQCNVKQKEWPNFKPIAEAQRQ
jgi:hypothetical protein